MRRYAVRVAVVLAAAVCFFGDAGSALGDTTVDFDGYPAGTTISNQYANLGGSGQGVVFGPLPGGVAGLNPVVRTPPSGQAQSGSQVADVSTCFACEFPVPGTTGTFAVPRSHVSVYVGSLGTADTCTGAATDPGCAYVTLRAVDANGVQVATTPATLVKTGAGVHTQLSVSTSSNRIVGFQIAAADGNDNGKQIAIDDLSFDAPVTPAQADFTLTPANANVNLIQGSGAIDPIAIARIGGSSGNVNLSVSGTLPSGVHAQLAPNPAGGVASTLTLTADPTAPPTLGTPGTVTVTGTPASSAVGPAPRSFSVTVGVKQAFDVRLEGSTSVNLSSCSLAVPVEVIRDLAYPGPVSLSVTGLPAGVQASFSPAQATFPNGAGAQTIELNLTAPATGQTVLARPATIHATAPGFPERTTTVTVGGTCPLQYDPEVISMQITQGTQLAALPHRDPSNPGAAVTYASTGNAAAPNSLEALAKLAAFKPTIVRVYADLRDGPPSGLQVPAVLNGYKYDPVSGKLSPLPGGPLLPVSTPGNLVVGLAQRVSDLQDGYAGVYTFVLPTSWERGKIKLEADLLPAQSGPVSPVSAKSAAHTATVPGQTPAYAPCTTTACQVNDRFAISEIPFLYTFSATVRPVAMINTNPYDATLPDPTSVFKWAGVVTPVPLIVEPYAATIDIGDQLGKDNSTGAVTSALANKVWDYVCQHGSPDHGWVVGIQHNDIRSAKSAAQCINYLPPGLTPVTFAFVNAGEPLTSVSHELFHLFGRPHASSGCGAAVGIGGTGTQSAEDWPPDQMGFLQSVGLAPATSGSFYPYQVLPEFSSIPADQWHDFMTYCEVVSDGDPLGATQNAWVSVHNWNAILASFGYSAARDRRSRAHAAVKTQPSFQIAASVDPGGRVTILSVDPVNAPPQPAVASPFHLIASDATGHTTADVPMSSFAGHTDARPPQPTLRLQGVVPAAAVASVSVLSGGATLATRKRSAHAPSVKIPQLPSFAGSRAIVRWRAADADGDPLAVEVDYSGDGGRTWGLVWMGPNREQARLPARYLSRSSNARIRVIVGDGFQTTTDLSTRFRSPGAPPTVHILMPWPRLRQYNDAPLVLSGQGFDDRSRLLTGRALRWMLGRRLLGIGNSISVSGLPAGAHRIELIARDRFRRLAVASVAVRLQAAEPLFLKLSGPRTIGRNARSLGLIVSSSLAATFEVRVTGLRPQRFAVARATRHLLVRLPRAHKLLSLRVSLAAGGRHRTAVLKITR